MPSSRSSGCTASTASSSRAGSPATSCTSTSWLFLGSAWRRCGWRVSCPNRVRGDDSVDDLADLERNPEAERCEGELTDEREQQRPPELASGPRGDEVEPGVAEQRGAGDRGRDRHE